MKNRVQILAFLLVCLLGGVTAFAGNLPTDEQGYKLAAAVWKEPPNSIDVTIYKRILRPPKTAEVIRKQVESFFETAEGPKESLGSFEREQLNRDIQLNVQRLVKEQQMGRELKKRIRIDGSRQRIDSVLGQPKMVFHEGSPYEVTQKEIELGPNTPFNMTFVNSGETIKGDNISFTYYHDNKVARIRDSRWKQSDVRYFAGLPQKITLFLKSMLGQKQDTSSSPIYVPDNEKINKFVTAELGKLSLEIRPDPNAPDTRVRLEIGEPNSFPTTVMVCDKDDYSRVYSLKNYLPTTGQLLYSRECSNFDFQGFPQNITVIEHDMEGKVKKKEVYRVEKVELNPSIPDEVFEFNPPEGYKVVDNRKQ